jgi:hypothetical protein
LALLVGCEMKTENEERKSGLSLRGNATHQSLYLLELVPTLKKETSSLKVKRFLASKMRWSQLFLLHLTLSQRIKEWTKSNPSVHWEYWDPHHGRALQLFLEMSKFFSPL